MKLTLVAALGAAALTVTTAHAGSSQPSSPAEPKPLVIGHRGSAGYMPEHTLASYALAIELGADYIEPDLVSTKDGALIARHEPDITNTTDVAAHPEFAARKTTKVLDGVSTTGWFASDFTLAEIKTLRAVQTIPSERFTGLDGDFQIPTLQEVIHLAKVKSLQKGRTIGIYPETKHPTFHRSLGLPLEDRLLAVLSAEGLNRADAPVFIQSFEQSNLQYLDTKTDVRLVQLVDGDDVNLAGDVTFAPPFDRPYDWTVSGRTDLFGYLTTPAGLDEVATYADGIGPWKTYLVRTVATDANGDGKADDVNGDGRVDERDRTLVGPTPVIADAHARGLIVHTWTFRSEQRRLTGTYQGSPTNELRSFYEAGIDGVFADFPDDAYAARVQFLLAQDPSLLGCLTQPLQAFLPRCRNIAPRLR